ncbi:PREDICTED: MPN domain-containing protein-like [Priapulus caudatus]|uniref:MPN domain-containing protein-like n=1 Tax=Priapulus caudatus TaxID=37621 RepID=A0ABM1F7S1_PRICU|nr:PREDICTED: MPN domain-containing protein-like [Priapulus caudatus]
MASEVPSEAPSECVSVSEISENEGVEKSEEDNGSDGDPDAEEMASLSSSRGGASGTGRGVTLNMLMRDGIIDPGPGNMSVSYLGQKFFGDLMSDGTIQLQTTKELFSSPSAWAIHCKKMVNPAKRSGCGWGSVKYKGRKLDTYKTMWFNKQRPCDGKEIRKPQHLVMKSSDNGDTSKEGEDELFKGDPSTSTAESHALSGPNADGKKVTISHRHGPFKYSDLGQRSPEHDQNSLVECMTFQSLGKIQPYSITVSSSCLFLMDFHCHLTGSEVVGYLAGTWEPLIHRLTIQRAFPCRCRLGDKDNALIIEEEIRQNMTKETLALVGWYHSHPTAPAQPSLKDIDAQLDYQVKLNLTKYHPCIGVVCSSYNPRSNEKDTAFSFFMAMPPETAKVVNGQTRNRRRTNERAVSMVTPQKWLADFHFRAPDLVKFSETWKDDETYMDKLRASLSSKLPRDQTDERMLLNYVEQLAQLVEGVDPDR